MRRKPVIAMADRRVTDFPCQNNGSKPVLLPGLQKGTAAPAHGLCSMKLS